MTLQAAVEHFAPHHEELRKRLVRCFLVITVTTVIAYLFIDQIVAFCMQPLYTAYPALQKLVYTKLTEAFITYLKLSLLVGMLVKPFSLPSIMYIKEPRITTLKHTLSKKTTIFLRLACNAR